MQQISVQLNNLQLHSVPTERRIATPGTPMRLAALVWALYVTHISHPLAARQRSSRVCGNRTGQRCSSHDSEVPRLQLQLLGASFVLVLLRCRPSHDHSSNRGICPSGGRDGGRCGGRCGERSEDVPRCGAGCRWHFTWDLRPEHACHDLHATHMHTRTYILAETHNLVTTPHTHTHNLTHTYAM